MLAGVGLLVVCCSSSSAFMMMGSEDPVVPKTPTKKSPEQIEADEDAAPDPPPPSDSYRIEVGIDYPGSDIFYYSPDGDIKATKDVCLDKCTDLPACKLVTFNNAETLCWGKSVAENKRDHGDRNNYFKN
jgi:hypothetical protein